MTALKAGEEVQQLCPASGSTADWNYCSTAWNKPRMSLAGWGRCRAFPDCLIIHMNRHTSVMKCSWNDWNDEHNHLQSFLHHQGAQQGSGTAPATGTAPSWELLPVPLGKDRDTIPNPNNAPGTQCHQDYGIQQSPEPLGNFPHSVRAQNEGAGIAHEQG